MTLPPRSKIYRFPAGRQIATHDPARLRAALQWSQLARDTGSRNRIAAIRLDIADGIFPAQKVLLHADLLRGISVHADQQIIAILMEGQAGAVHFIAAGI